MHYTLTGNTKLPALVLLHGWMGSCVDYEIVIGLLRSHFYCIAIDLPGHGKTRSIDRDYKFINTATNIIQLLDSLRIDRAIICGYSFGGRLALYLALEFPDRFSQVILESTSPGLEAITERELRIANDQQITSRLTTTPFPDFLTHWYQQPIFRGIESHLGFSQLIQRRLDNQPVNLAKSLQFAGLGKQPYLGERLKDFTGQILLIVGEEDRKFVSLANIINLNCNCISLAIVPNSSHNVHFQSPHRWVELVGDFLRGDNF